MEVLWYARDMITAFLLGNNRELSIFEIKAVLKRHSVSFTEATLAEEVFGISSDKVLDTKLFYELGGSIRMMEIVAAFDKNSRESIEQKMVSLCSDLVFNKSPKSVIGFSGTGFHFSKPRLLNIAKSVKKLAKKNEQRVQFILPGKGTVLSAAQVIKHNLTDDGLEFVFISGRDKVFMGRTTAVQDIDAWAQKDVGKPVRDIKKGMLPPKLARMMLNIALPVPLEPETPKILDPFCGTGTVLMEAMELGVIPCGVDMDPDQVAAARKNVNWMNELLGRELDPAGHVILGDAREIAGLESIKNVRFNAIITEPYLGPALTKKLNYEEEKALGRQLSELYAKFLVSARGVLKPGGMLLAVFPKWSKRGAFEDIIDKLGNFGYILINDLLYRREGQFVSRQIIVLKRK